MYSSLIFAFASSDNVQDLEMNRYDENGKKRGMFVKTPKKKAKVHIQL